VFWDDVPCSLLGTDHVLDVLTTSIIALVTDAVSTSGTLVSLYDTSRCNIPEGSHLHTRRSLSLKSQRFLFYLPNHRSPVTPIEFLTDATLNYTLLTSLVCVAIPLAHMRCGLDEAGSDCMSRDGSTHVMLMSPGITSRPYTQLRQCHQLQVICYSSSIIAN
jgi:hypothetical protein